VRNAVLSVFFSGGDSHLGRYLLFSRKNRSNLLSRLKLLFKTNHFDYYSSCIFSSEYKS